MGQDQIPIFASIAETERVTGLKRNFLMDLMRGGGLKVLMIEGRPYVRLRDSIDYLREISDAGGNLSISTPEREANLARKTEFRMKRRAAKRAADAEKKREAREAKRQPEARAPA